MTEEKVTIYRCNYCRKYGLRKYAIERHEKFCHNNPANHHACLTCAFLNVERIQNDNGYNEKTFHCGAKDIELHSFKAEKINHSCLGHTERMPLVCDQHKFDNTPDF